MEDIMTVEIYEVKCPQKIDRDITVTATVPGSKSITNRALLLAALANGKSTLHGCLTSDDAKHFLECIRQLGFPVAETPDGALGSDITITGFGGDIPSKNGADLYVGSAGTAARFLTAMLALSNGIHRIQASEQMCSRPMQPLFDALVQCGGFIECIGKPGHLPVFIMGEKRNHHINTKIDVTVDIDKSSQFLSALLISSVIPGKEFNITVTGSHGLSYVDMTVAMMQSFGVTPKKSDDGGRIKYSVSASDSYKPLDYRIEPDMSAAAYFYALAAILGAKVEVKGVRRDMLQGDIAFLEVLQKMGCEVVDTANGIAVHGADGGALKGGFSADMSRFSDQALTLAAIAPYADAPITITGIGHIRFQECDRIEAIIHNLDTLGIKAEEHSDSITIYPGTPNGGIIETYDDHRVAMSFALTGLRTAGVKIKNPSCCKKTFAEYFDVLEGVVSALEQPL